MKWLIFGTIVATACVACNRPDDARGTGNASAFDPLTEELRKQVAENRPRVVLDAQRVRFTRTSSEAVPGLDYLQAEYTPGEMSEHATFFVFGAARAGDTVVVTRAPELLRLVGSWQPGNAQQAVTACSEFAAWTTERKHPRRMPVLFTDTAVLRHGFVAVHDSAAIDELEGPQQLSPNGAVRVWVVEIGGSHQYQCEFQQDQPRIHEVSSTSGVLLLAPGS